MRESASSGHSGERAVGPLLTRPFLSDLLLYALIFLVPMMKPAPTSSAIAADLLFVGLVLVIAVEAVLKQRRLHWLPAFGALLVYVVCLAPSLLATSDLGASLFKLATEFYLIGLAAVAALLIDEEEKLRRALMAWLAATAVVIVVCLLSLVAFATGWPQAVLDYSSFGFGSLPAGHYPRLALTFWNANMACNYLTVSAGIAVVCRKLGYMGQPAFVLLLAGVGLAALSTISPGLGGLALLGGFIIWTDRRVDRRIRLAALVGAILVAALAVMALALTPFAHASATFRIDLGSRLSLYPGPRLLIWIAAFRQFMAHPLIGIGIGIDPVHVAFQNPNGFELLTDAHNIFLSIAVQCGIVGLVGLAAIVTIIVPGLRPVGSRAGMARLVLCATFADVLLYQGLGGSFEDTRHIWLLLGLCIAAARIRFTHRQAATA